MVIILMLKSDIYLLVQYQTHMLYYHYLLLICTCQMWVRYQVNDLYFFTKLIYDIDVHIHTRSNAYHIIYEECEVFGSVISKPRIILPFITRNMYVSYAG